jgi:hypothetical protein
MSTTKTYPLTKRPQLIDLNGENVNFKLDFFVDAQEPNNEFQAIVLTQDQLDSVDMNKIEMKVAKGKISGNISANNNKYQNYFLVLKKKEESIPDFDVEVKIQLEKLEISENPELESITENYSIPAEQTDIQTTECATPFYRKPWFWVFLAILALVVGVFVYNYVYLKKPFVWAWSSAPGSDSKTCSVPKASVESVTSVASAPVAPVAPIQTRAVQEVNSVETQLYNKLSEIAP